MNLALQLPAFEVQFLQLLTHRYEAGERRMLFRLLLEQVDHTALRPQDWHWLHQATERLLAGEPIQYITGWGHFYGREFRVQPGVLIPRGETEELMCLVRDWGVGNGGREVRGLDIGTGSGCIPISLFLEWQERGIASELVGIDVSETALATARQNAVQLGAEVSFVSADLFQRPPLAYQELDFVVSNPPYIPQQEAMQMDQHVVEHEPPEALFVPDEDPLLFYRVIAEKSQHWLREGGVLFLEIHRDFGPQVAALLEQANYQAVQLRKDLNGNPRFVTGRV